MSPQDHALGENDLRKELIYKMKKDLKTTMKLFAIKNVNEFIIDEAKARDGKKKTRVRVPDGF